MTAWLWDERVPLGALTLLEGPHETGKTALAYRIAAEVTLGTLPGEHSPQEVLVVATEDDWQRKALPGLIVAGADLDYTHRVNVVPGRNVAGMPLRVDMGDLEWKLTLLSPALVLIDPLVPNVSTVGPPASEADVREALAPLLKMCERANAAAIGVVTTYPTEQPRHAALMSLARSVLATAELEDGAVQVDQIKVAALGTTGGPVGRFRSIAVPLTETEHGTVWADRAQWLVDDAEGMPGAEWWMAQVGLAPVEAALPSYALTTNEKLVAFTIAVGMGPDTANRSFGADEVARSTGLSRAEVDSCTQALVRKGWLVAEPTGYRGTAPAGLIAAQLE